MELTEIGKKQATMKRLFYLAAIATVAFGCTKVDVEENNIGAALSEREITVTVNSAESGTPISKVGYNPNDAEGSIDIVWSEDDALNVVMSDYSASKFEMVDGSMSDDATSAQFAGSILGEDYRLVYPYDTNIDIYPQYKEFFISVEEQTIDMSDNGLNSMSKYNYMVSPWLNANDDNETVTMQHITAAVKLGMRFTGLDDNLEYTISRVSLGGLYATLVSDLSYDIASDNFILSPDDDWLDTYISNSPAVVNYSQDDDNSEYHLFVTVMPTLIEGNNGVIQLQVTLRGSDGNDYTQYFDYAPTEDIDIERASYTTLNYNCDMTDAYVSARLFDGSGIAEDPYLIQTADDMWRLSSARYNDEYSFRNCYFLLTNDIDLACSEEKQWVPIKELEEFYFDGGGHTISGLYINNEERYQGLFEYILASMLCNLTVEGEITSTNKNIGGLVGKSKESLIINCHNRANITGESRVGGVIGGGSENTILNCSNSGTISGNDLGDESDDTLYDRVGGITGTSSDGMIIGCYNAGEVSNANGNAYAVAARGGDGFATIFDCYYAKDCGGYPSGSSTIEVTLDEMKSPTFVATLNSAKSYAYLYTFSDITEYPNEWIAVDGDLPTTSMTPIKVSGGLFSGGDGTSTSPFLISSTNDLIMMSVWSDGIDNIGYYFLLTCDLDLNGSEENPWVPIGNNNDLDDVTFDGGGHTITGLYINNSDSHQGLFGDVEDSTIKNLTVEGEVVSNKKNIGGIAGKLEECIIINCHNRVNVTGASRVGGISGGGGYSIFVNCSNSGTITGDDDDASFDGRVGGIAGTSSHGYIFASYNIGEVSNLNGDAYGLIAAGGEGFAQISDCYYSSDCGGINTGDTENMATELEKDYMASEEFVALLNEKAALYYNFYTINRVKGVAEWVMGTNGYPTTNMEPLSMPEVELFSGGDGYEESPYLISNVEDLKTLAEYHTSFDDTYFLLTCDIDLEGSESNPWSPIGDYDNYFSGNYFDGGEHTISGLYASGESFVGLFGYIEGAIVQNLTVEGEVNSSDQNAGGIAGMAYSSIIANCHNRATITGISRVGGIAGGAGYSFLLNCSNSGTITGDDNSSSGYSNITQMRVGGIAGTSGDTYIYGCYNVGQVANNSGDGYPIAAPGGDDSKPTYTYNCYYADDCGGVDAFDSATELTTSYMSSSDFVEDLNLSLSAINKVFSFVKTYGWVATELYPTTSVDAGTTGGDGTLPDNMGKVSTDGGYGDGYFSGGDGSTDNPYLISTAEDLIFLSEWSDELDKCHFLMTADIDLTGVYWTPIGYNTASKSLSNCIFDGGDHTISGLNIDTDSCGALFYDLNNSTITNLTVKGSISATYDRAAGFAATATNSYFVGCHNEATITTPSYTAGIVAQATNCYILNCSNRGAINSNDYLENSDGDIFTYAGGLIGSLDGGVVYGCYNTGLLTNEAKAGTIDAILFHDPYDTDPVYCYNNFYSDDCNAQDLFSTAEKMSVSEMSESSFAGDGGINSSTFAINGNSFFGSVPVSAYAWVVVSGGTPTTSIAAGYQKGVSYMPENNGLVDFSISTGGDGSSTEGDGLYSGGYGTSTSPYLVSNSDDLWFLSDNYTLMNNKYFIVTCDIDLEGSENNQWTPIGYDKDDYIKGITFDGAGYTISGIYINNQASSNSGYQGLFGHIYFSTISNLTVEGSITSKFQNSGGVTGMANNGSTIINCHNKVNITGTSRVGGIAGGAGDSYIYNCSNSGAIIGDEYDGNFYDDNIEDYRSMMRIGGIAGTSSGTKIINCYNVGTVQNLNSASEAAAFAIASPGGLLGYYLEEISNCYYSEDCGGVDIYNTSTAYTSDYMQSTEFVTLLNSNISGDMLEWHATETYPTTVVAPTALE